MVSDRPVLQFPRPLPWTNMHHHYARSCFHGLVMMWQERGWIDLEMTDSPFIWWGGVGRVLLYNWPTLEHLNPHVQYDLGLFANADLPLNGRVNKRWIFWARSPDLIERWHDVAGRRGYGARRHGCAFMGGYENKVQRGYRWAEYWRPACDFWNVGIKGSNLTGSQYLRVLFNSRFGLCLRGTGAKCHREIECMAMGCVPILTAGVSTEYHEPLVAGRHYLLARGVEDVGEMVATTTAKDWAEMSWQGRDWYWRNAAARGAFDVTQGIVDGTVF